MPSDTHRLRSLYSETLELPPPFHLISLREVGDAFTHAQAVAAEEGAGTLVHVGRFDLAEFAVVLEPEEPLRLARRSFYAGMVALVDALIAYAPPEKPVTVAWPGAVSVDGGLIGGGRLAWPAGASEDAPPDWLVFGATIRTVAMGEEEPGLLPLSSALDQEGFDDLTSGRLVESFTRHLMVAVDGWQETGFASVGKKYLRCLAPESGIRSGLDDNGDLLRRHAGKAVDERRPLKAALAAAPSWLDPATGGPRK